MLDVAQTKREGQQHQYRTMECITASKTDISRISAHTLPAFSATHRFQ